jgi:hypothetical protein
MNDLRVVEVLVTVMRHVNPLLHNGRETIDYRTTCNKKRLRKQQQKDAVRQPPLSTR